MTQRVLLISPGGCACTAFISYLKKYINNINNENDTDKLKHTLPWNPSVKNYNPTHIIYLYGDLDKAVRSLFRRNYHNPQYRKLNNIFKNKDIPIPFNNFKQYIKLVENAKIEPLGIFNHYKAWKSVPNVFFIHYENIQKTPLLDDFLGLPKGTCSKFPIKERTSQIRIIESKEYLEIMNELTNQIKNENTY